MKIFNKNIYFTFVIILIGCGGGGGDSSSGDTNGSSSICGKIGLDPRIINGSSCSNLSRSPIVRIISNYKSGRPGYCTGTMIAPTKVLTAGHCGENIFDTSDTRLETTVVTGASGDSQFIKATSVVVHPGLRVEGPHIFNDLAIVTLSHAVDLPLLPVLTSNVPSVGSEVEIYGYGRTQTGTPPYVSYDQLLKQPLDLRSGMMILANISDFHLRADALAGAATICHGDSGGPLIYIYNGEATIIGVASQVVANGLSEHCAVGTYGEWTRLQAPSVRDELIDLVPDVEIR